MKEARRKRVLFICTHNSARSQIAEGIVNHLYHDRCEAYSAGTKPTQVNPFAIRVMKEIDIDISGHKSKRVREFDGQDFDSVVTLCSDAEDICPFVPAKEHVHRGFDDPSRVTGSQDDRLAAFRKTRDEIKQWVMETFGRDERV